MEKIIGLVPAGGKAQRIHGFFKEMMPIGIDEHDKSKFIVSSEQIVGRILNGGATAIHFVITAQKAFIAEYYAKQHIYTRKINFNYLTEDVENKGMPYAIDYVYELINDADYILMGMPDTVIEPNDSFSRVLNLLRQRKADLALGLYRTDSRNRGGFIEFNHESKQIIKHIDKTSIGFPNRADNSWAIACWNKKFTEYMHDCLSKGLQKKAHRNSNTGNDLLFGDIIDIAISDASLFVVGDFVDEKSGFYWDIAEPEKYFDLLRLYEPSEGTISLAPTALFNPIEPRSVGKNKIFIGHGHSNCWEQLRDFLQNELHLEWEEFNRIPVAGMSVKERLLDMLEEVGIAFIIMTGEEQSAEGNFRARDNVIHEVGLFQGQLGFMRTIILLEDGCNEFSNIIGVLEIRFPKGNILAKSEEIERVLKREGILNTDN